MIFSAPITLIMSKISCDCLSHLLVALSTFSVIKELIFALDQTLLKACGGDRGKPKLIFDIGH